MNERNVLITSALPYVNNEPHLGNIIGCVLSADVYARFCRLRGDNVLYVCGTDEYGTTTETKALEEGVPCQTLCDKYHAIHRDVYSFFDIDFDYFGRTTTEMHTTIVQDIFVKCHENGYMSANTVTQLYCDHCNRFLADRMVEGICPKCKFQDARGDQCDACQHLLNATDLISPRCKFDGNKPVTRDSKHMFIELPRLQERLSQYVKENSITGKWTSNSIAVTNGWLKEGLKARCMTRDLKWGVPVPLEEMKGKTIYVWFDAPIGYPSITANYTSDWHKWWKAPEDVKLYQFMGKDNIPFHTVLFPSYLLATHEKWTMLHHISTTEYLNYENGKFSKSRNTGVFGSNVRDIGISVAVWRYYLLANRPETNDSVFTWKDFISRNNNELLNNLGNYCNRVLKFIASPKYGGSVPKYNTNDSADTTFIQDVNDLLSQYIESLEAVKIRQGLQVAMTLSARGNQFLQDNKLDNSLYNSNPERCNTVLGIAVNLMYLLSAVFYPYMPSMSKDLCAQLNMPQRSLKVPHLTFDITSSHQIGKLDYLFQRIDEKMEFVYQQRYGGGSTTGLTVGSTVVGASTPNQVSANVNSSSKAKSKAKFSTKQDPIKLLEAFISHAGKDAVPALVLELQNKTEQQGLLVRQLKTDKAEAIFIQEAIDSLLQLKTELLEQVCKLG